MRQLREAQLAQWIAASLLASMPRTLARLSTQTAAQLVRKAIAGGRSIGLRYDEDLLIFARVHLMLGSGFATNPSMRWTHAYLDDWDPDVGERIARLEAEAFRRHTGEVL